MKYYHVIYNSSQKGLNGSNGFGIRTATEGTPREYLDAVVKGTEEKKFSNVVVNSPTIQELVDTEGKAILRVPPRYLFQTLDVEGGRLFVLARNIYLGFTETFYYKDKEGNILGKSGRPGGYLIDMYLFEDCPTKEVFDILYESPAGESNRFKPLDPSPHKENFEMAELSTGDPVMLKPEERPFASTANTVSPKVTDLLLAIIDAKLTGRQLFVKYPWQQTNRLIADAFRFLPDSNIHELTFSTNYTGNGFNAPADILFMNEYYKGQFAGKGLTVDLEASDYQGAESQAFRDSIADALNANDYVKVRKIMAWVLSPDYKNLGNVSADTKAVMFIYNQMPEDFKLRMVDEARNREELVSAMSRSFAQSRDKSRRFVELLTEKVDLCNDISQIISAVKDLEYFTGKGIDVSSVKENQKFHINEVIMNQEEPGNALRAIKELGLRTVRAYTNDFSDGRERADLAAPLFDIWKESIPTTLDDLKNRLATAKAVNGQLYNLILSNFSSLFSGLYQSFVSNINARNAYQAKELLERDIITPLYSEQALKQDSLYQNFILLYNILSDNESYVNATNFETAVDIVGKTGLADTRVGTALKKFVLDYANQRNIDRVVERLTTVWHLRASEIISECQGSPMKNEIIKGAIEKSGFDFNRVLEILDEHKIDYAFLANSQRYGNEYKSYKRKQSFGNILSKIASLFKPSKKEGKAEKKRDQGSKGDKNSSKSSSHDEPSTIEDPTKARRRKFYENRPKEEWPKDLLTWLIVGMLSLGGSLNAAAAGQSGYHNSYGDDKSDSLCYIVSAQTLNVRTSPSLYKGKRKSVKRKDNIGLQLSQGDTVFVAPATPFVTEDGVGWLSFVHDGVKYYADCSKFYLTGNPRSKDSAASSKGSDYNPDGFLGWLRNAAPWILLVITLLGFGISFLINTPDKDSLQGEPRDDTGIRPMFMYSLRPYKFFAGLSFRLLIGLAASIVVMLIIGGIVWGALWVVKLLVWLLIIVGWICVVVGLLGFLGAPALIPLAIVGGVILYFEDGLKAFGERCVETGMSFFDALNMWEFTYDLIQNYWLHAVVISLIPLALFLIAAAVMMLVAWCLRGYEAFTTYRYNVKHPCPWCHEPSEPAQYFDEDPANGLVPLPCNLRPGIYGLFHITHPATGNELPTLIANGRDQLARTCPHCGHAINFEAGTEKHIGFIGMPESGKTSLLCNVIGVMMKDKSDMHFTNTTDDNIKEIEDDVKFAKGNGHLDPNHLPPKTDRDWRASIQCIIPRHNSNMPYHLYFNDVSGELFTAGGNDKQLLRFSQDVENIVFIIDPWTMKLNEQTISDRMKAWLKQEEVELMRASAQEEVLTAFDSLINALEASKRDFAKINFNFALVKSDTGYLEGVDTSKESELEHFMKDDMKLGNVVHAAESRFKSVTFIAVSVFNKNDKGVRTLCNKLLDQLEIE